ncbi:30S ribosomal protein S8e [archaeon]|jgi:small subunit ribosomal protein S8e|nr:30S ribosomal protein S8e [archaeon]MBT3451142.1 30S ribosomal protein S8e [archaeon]MBT6869546.1 30S ribosomal protein S8e [archaeon]MBT7193711.1 30S ribosomal protein S8e [archaeon]MBT7380402.1 30S ribosomal protein S8e [archaeon]
MARSQLKSKRKASGGRFVSARAKKKRELAGYSANTKLDEPKAKVVRVRGGNTKSFLLSGDYINVTNQEGKAKKVKITNVLENKANPHLVRRNILTKGAIVETELGKVKITGRPGQENNINGVLIKQ